MRRTAILFAIITLLAEIACAAGPATSPGNGPSLRRIGSVDFPVASTQSDDGKSFLVGELSGMTWLGGDRWLAVADKGNHVVRFTIQIDHDSAAINSSKINGAFTLKAPPHDYEGIAYSNARNSIFVSEEDTPAIDEYSLAADSKLAPSRILPPTLFTRIRGNRGFESLSLAPDGKTLWTANEEALTVDGPESSTKAPTLVRLLRFNVTDRVLEASAQFAYAVDPIHATQTGARPAERGLSDLAALPDGRLLALERECVWNKNPFGIGPRELPSFENAIYLVDLTGATDVSRIPSLPAAEHRPVAKKLLWSATATIDNLEGLSLGPPTAHGWSVLAITDNQLSDSKGLLPTRIVAFELRLP